MLAKPDLGILGRPVWLQRGAEVVISCDLDQLSHRESLKSSLIPGYLSWGKPRGSSIFSCDFDQLSRWESLKSFLILGYLSWGKPRGSSIFLAFQPPFWHLEALRLFFFGLPQVVSPSATLTWLLGSSKVLYDLKNPKGLQQLRLLYTDPSHSMVRSTWQYPRSWGSSTSSPSLDPNGNPQFRWSKLR